MEFWLGTSKHQPKNIQHRGFAGGHPPNYWSGGHWLDPGRADGIPYFPAPMVVCDGRQCYSRFSMTLLCYGDLCLTS